MMKEQLANFYKGIIANDVLTIEARPTIRKPEAVRLLLTDSARDQLQKAQIYFPHEMGPCSEEGFREAISIIRGKTPRRYGMYREDVLQPNGTFKRVRRCVLLGPVSSMSERAAWKAFQPYLDRVNTAAKMPPKSGVTLETFVREWRTSVAVNLKGSTSRAAESHLRAHILPQQSATAHLIELCRQKLAEYEAKRGEQIWQHRKLSSGYISGTLTKR